MTREDTNRQGTIDTTRDSNQPRRKPQQQQGSGEPRRQQQQRSPSTNPGGGEPDVQETPRDRESSTGAPRPAQIDVERGGSGGDLPM